MNKPYIGAADRNKEAIFKVLKPFLHKGKKLLEIGSGTGQHGVYCCERLPHLQWQPTELEYNIPGIRQWIADSQARNILDPLVLDVTSHNWRQRSYDFVFTSNTTHYMSWSDVTSMFAGVSSTLTDSGLFFTYGPFHRSGFPVTDGNKKLDEWLQEQSLEFRIRSIDELENLGGEFDFRLEHSFLMPANNYILVFCCR